MKTFVEMRSILISNMDFKHKKRSNNNRNKIFLMFKWSLFTVMSDKMMTGQKMRIVTSGVEI